MVPASAPVMAARTPKSMKNSTLPRVRRSISSSFDGGRGAAIRCSAGERASQATQEDSLGQSRREPDMQISS